MFKDKISKEEVRYRMALPDTSRQLYGGYRHTSKV